MEQGKAGVWCSSPALLHLALPTSAESSGGRFCLGYVQNLPFLLSLYFLITIFLFPSLIYSLFGLYFHFISLSLIFLCLFLHQFCLELTLSFISISSCPFPFYIFYLSTPHFIPSDLTLPFPFPILSSYLPHHSLPSSFLPSKTSFSPLL